MPATLTPLLRDKSLLLAKAEVTYGTDPVPVGADAVLISDLEITPDVEFNQRQMLDANLSPVRGLPGARMCTVKFKSELKWDGILGNVQEWDPLFKASACAVTALPAGAGTADDTIEIAPAAPASPGSVAFYANFDGWLWKVLGCRGGFSLSFEAGKIIEIDWEFMGFYADPTDTALAAPAFDANAGIVALSGAYSLDAITTLVVPSFKFDLNQRITKRPSLSEATGYGGFDFTGRTPKVAMKVEATKIADFNWWTRLLDATGKEMAFAYGPAGPADNKVKFQADKMEFTGVKVGDDDGRYTFDVDGQCNRNVAAGNDEFKITFSRTT